MACVRVKVCGVTTPADVGAAADAGADAVGVNFYPPSPRYVPPGRAAELLRSVPPLLTPVGVFVHRPLAEVYADAARLGLRSVQWYGDEPPADPNPFALIPAFRVKGAASLAEVAGFVSRWRGAGVRLGAVLVDGHAAGQMGGAGVKAPWELLADFRPGVPVILAGGLTPGNVGEAVRRVRPWGVDVASGVESEPGRKDPDLVRRFVEAVREAAARLG